MKTVIRLDKVSKSYTLGEKKITALKEFSFEVKSGEFVAVMGNLLFLRLQEHWKSQIPEQSS